MSLQNKRLLLNHKKTPGFLASGGEKFNPLSVTRLDHAELLCNKVLLKYKRDRESFWHRHEKGAERVPPLLQRVFPNQGSNPGLHWRQILYCLSHQGSPIYICFRNIFYFMSIFLIQRLLCPWNFPGKNTGVGRHPSPRALPNPGIKPKSLALQADSLQSEPPGK